MRFPTWYNVIDTETGNKLSLKLLPEMENVQWRHIPAHLPNQLSDAASLLPSLPPSIPTSPSRQLSDSNRSSNSSLVTGSWDGYQSPPRYLQPLVLRPPGEIRFSAPVLRLHDELIRNQVFNVEQALINLEDFPPPVPPRVQEAPPLLPLLPDRLVPRQQQQDGIRRDVRGQITEEQSQGMLLNRFGLFKDCFKPNDS